jgi:hypothetical protein
MIPVSISINVSEHIIEQGLPMPSEEAEVAGEASKIYSEHVRTVKPSSDHSCTNTLKQSQSEPPEEVGTGSSGVTFVSHLTVPCSSIQTTESTGTSSSLGTPGAGHTNRVAMPIV